MILNHRAADLKISDLKLNVDGVDISANANPQGRQFTVILTFLRVSRRESLKRWSLAARPVIRNSPVSKFDHVCRSIDRIGTRSAAS